MKHVLLAFVVLLGAGCSGLIFQPTRQHYYLPQKAEQELEIKIESVYFDSRDGTKLHGWFLPNQVGKSRGSILFLHGNGQNISNHLGFVWWLPRNGYDVFLFDYRGYGHSEGEPGLEGVHEDIQSAMQVFLARQDIRRDKLVLYGHSLGGALAITSLVDSPYRKYFTTLIVEGAFTRYRTAAREVLGRSWLTWLFQYPLSWTIRDDFAPVEVVERISPTPVLFIHGEEDAIIAPHHSQELFQTAKQPKQFWLVKNAGHNVFMTPSLRQQLLDYLDKIPKNPVK